MNSNLWMGVQEILVVKRDVADNAKPVCYSIKLEDITEMPIDIKLFDNSVCVFGGVFRDKSFNSRGIKDRHISFYRINSLADWFRDIHKGN